MTTPTPSTAAGPTAAGGKRALLIGIDAYESVRSLAGCVNDILEIRDFLITKLGMRPEDIQFLASPPVGTALPAGVAVTAPPTRANIMAALDRLAQQIGAQDQVVIYYSGHGVWLGQGGDFVNPNNPNQHFSAIAPSDTRMTGANLVLNTELNAAVNRLLAANATVTAVFDACHSGGVATRDLTATGPDAPAAREIVLEPDQIDWAAFAAEHNLQNAPPDAATRAVGGDGSGWVASFDQAKELIVVAGCRDVELSHEYTPAGTRHGALTYFLLDTLRNTAAAQVPTLHWQDIYPRIRGSVNGLFADQTPTLEGQGERPVFGGAWQPYDPGFTVTVGDGGGIALDGGLIHGLGKGAQVRIYPPGTADFTQADGQRVPVALAEVTDATPVSSNARFIAGAAGSVVNGARARIIKPSIGTPPLAVALTDLPPTLDAAIRGAAGAGAFLNFVPSVQEAAVQVCTRQRNGQTGWAILKARVPSSANPIGENDVIGFAKAAQPLADQDAQDLGSRLAAGLLQWGHYTAILNRRNDEPQLQGAISLNVLADADRAHLLSSWATPTAPLRPLNQAGEAVVRENERMLLKLKIGATVPTPLNVVILLCSDEGNIQVLFDTSNNPLPAGEERSVGLNGPLNPFFLTTSDWQTESRYTFKAFASDKDHPFDAQSLTLDETVQSLLDGASRGGIKADVPEVLWTTFELPVRIVKS